MAVSADQTEHTRRGLYVLARRNFRFPMFDVFDWPVNSVSASSREVTTVAPQALWLLNNATVNRQAEAFAGRVVNDGWNLADFGPGQSGWESERFGVRAGWAKRLDNGHVVDTFDVPVGSVMARGPASVTWRVPAGAAGAMEIRGGLWNLRNIGRRCSWKLWKNDALLSEGEMDDFSGTSANPLNLQRGKGGERALRITVAAGDRVRFEILGDDYAGVRLTLVTPQGERELAADFGMAANPTATGWEFSEAGGPGSMPLTRAIGVSAVTDAGALVERAWRLGLGRLPSPAEKTDALSLLKSLVPENSATALKMLCLAIFNMQEFVYVD